MIKITRNIIFRIRKDAWHSTMVQPWIGCLWVVLLTSAIVYLYLMINVPDAKHSTEYFKILGFSDRTRTKSVRTFESSFNTTYKCEPVHVAMVCAGFDSTFNLVTAVKSILFYRTTPLHFHLVVDEISMRTLVMLFQTWDLPHVSVSYYQAENWIPRVSWIPNKHYSGVYGLLKLILPDICQVPKILVIDTDVTFLNDVEFLWQSFNDFNEDQLLGLVENQSQWYSKTLLNEKRSWPALDKGFNTGIVVMNLKRLREWNFAQLWVTIAKGVLETIPETSLADQDIINAVIKEYPNIVYRIGCTWNIQLSDHTLSESCYSEANRLNVIHWNSPRKQNVHNKHIDDFRRMHNIFLELDGNLLRRSLLNCYGAEIPAVDTRYCPCQEFTKGASIRYRTHIFLLEFEYNVFSPADVALAIQCSADRATLLEEISKHWTGSISVALYLTDTEVQTFLEFVRSSENLRKRKNIAYHVVYKDGEFYPVNYLRNVAMLHISTPYILQLDIDFIPHFGLYESMMKHILKLKIIGSSKTALIVPAFETQRYRFKFPDTKEELLKSFNRGILYTFRYHVWAQGHAATNYTFWRNALEPYEVTWEPDFEPYMVVPNSTPKYDRRFIGFGWNKVSYVTHLTAMGYRYMVLPDTFIIHRPHAPSRDISKFRTDPLYRRCLKRLKDTFVEELIQKYGNSALLKLKTMNKRKTVPKARGPAAMIY